MSTLTERMGGRLPGRGRSDAPRPDGATDRASAGRSDRPAPPARSRDRRALVAVASLVVIGASVATFAGLYASAGHRTAVVVVEAPIAQGQAITASDLGQADLSVSGDVRYIPVAEAEVIRGKRAASALAPGSLLTPADLTGASAAAPGQAVVGIALKDGQIPAAGLTPGQQVMVVQTGTPGSPLSAATSATTSGAASGSVSALAGTGTGVVVPAATVVSVSAPGAASGGTYALLVSIAVTSALAPDVATAASADQVSLVLLPAGGSGAEGAS